MKPTDSDLRKVCEKWKLRGEFEFLRKVENWIYKDPVNRLYVRVTEPCHRSLEQLTAELDWIFFLKRKGVSVADPILSVEDRLVETVGGNFVSVFTEAKGAPIVTVGDFTENRMRNWGRLLGTLHSATIDYRPSHGIRPREQWNQDRNHLNILQTIRSNDVGFAQFQRLSEWLEQRSKGRLEYGMIHADIHHGNFFVDEHDNITVFDFDDCHYNWFAYDLALPIFSFEMYLRQKNSANLCAELRAAFLKGYEDSGPVPVSAEEISNFILYRNFILLGWCQCKLQERDLSQGAKDWIDKAIIYCGESIAKYEWPKV